MSNLINLCYTRDAWGNQLTVTVSGANIVSRTTTTTTYAGGRFPASIVRRAGMAY